MMTLLQIRAGPVRVYSSINRSDGSDSWTSAISKSPLENGAVLTSLGVEGDEHGDPVNHGGADKAILCYSREHYALWSQELGAAGPASGTLGENFEVEGTNEEQVCIGDIFQIGDIITQISQPRSPCWKPAQLHGIATLTAQILKTGRTGWYLRVLQTGRVTAAAEIRLLERQYPEWTVARATRAMYFEKDAALRSELAGLEPLSAAWKSALVG